MAWSAHFKFLLPELNDLDFRLMLALIRGIRLSVLFTAVITTIDSNNKPKKPVKLEGPLALGTYKMRQEPMAICH